MHDFDDESKACEIVLFVLDAIDANKLFIVCDLVDRSASRNMFWVVGSDFTAIFP